MTEVCLRSSLPQWPDIRWHYGLQVGVHTLRKLKRVPQHMVESAAGHQTTETKTVNVYKRSAKSVLQLRT